MQKKIIILILFLLTGCQNNSTVACDLEFENKTVDLDIKAINDNISSIHVRTCFVIPRTVMYDKDKIDFLNSQIDETFHFEDNILVQEYNVYIDDNYSLNKTIEYLNSKRYHCE